MYDMETSLDLATDGDLRPQPQPSAHQSALMERLRELCTRSATQSSEYHRTCAMEEKWREICALLEMWPADSLDGAIAACDRMLEQWPDAVRTTPERWWSRAARGHRERRLAITRTLDIRRAQLGESGILDLLEQPDITEITSLRIEGEDLSPHALEMLASTPALRTLRHLYLNHTGPLSTQSIRAFREAPWFEGLLTLSLMGVDLTDDGLVAIIRDHHLLAMTSLYLGDNALSDEGIRALTVAGALRNLEKLGLEGNPDITDASAHALRARHDVGFPHLTFVNLADCDVPTEHEWLMF